MTKTLTKAVSRCLAILVLPAMMPRGIAVGRSFVWNFEFGHWNLFVICFLVLGIFFKQANFAKLIDYGFK
jgi:hypothetical protein